MGRISDKCKDAPSRERGRLARFPNQAGGTPLLWFALFGDPPHQMTPPEIRCHFDEADTIVGTVRIQIGC